MDKDWVVARMAKGTVLKRRDAGDYVIGRRRLSQADVELLLSEDLLQPLADGRFDLTAAGKARARRAGLRRAVRPRRGGKAGETAGDDAFRGQHQLREQRRNMPDDGKGSVTVDLTESPLGWLRRRKNAQGVYYLNDRQVAAGERLRNDFERAALTPRVTAAWSGVPVGRGRRAHRGEDPADAQIAARQRFNTAVSALGPRLSDVAVRVCCFLDGLESVERRQGWPQRSGKVVLQIALDGLADHYGLDGAAEPALPEITP